MRFRRCTHDEKGELKEHLSHSYEDGWIMCCIQLIEPEWQSLNFIYDAHTKYDAQWGPTEGFNYSIADILSGLSHLIHLGLVEARR